MVSGVASTHVVERDGCTQRAADVLEEVGATVPVEIDIDQGAVAGDVVGIAVAVEVSQLRVGAAETVAVVMAGIDDDGGRRAGWDGEAEVETEIAVDAAAALDWSRQGAGIGLGRQEAGAGIEADLHVGAGRGDVVTKRLDYQVGEAVAVDVHQLGLGPRPIAGR